MLEPYDGEINEFYTDVALRNPTVEDGSFVSYEIVIETNNFSFSETKSAVRRRYSEFVLLRKVLTKEFPAWKLPSLPSKFPFKDHFNPEFIEERRKGLEDFLKKLVSQAIFLSSKALHLFLQTSHSLPEIKNIIQSKNIPPQSPQEKFMNQRFPSSNTNALSDDFSTVSLSSHTDTDASVSLHHANSSAVPNECSDSPAGSKRVSFCDQVTVAQVIS